MSTLTTINGWAVPALTDAPNIVTALTALSSIDARANPIFTTAAARDAAITAPVEGQECYVTGTKEKYVYNGTAWVSLSPRKIFLTSDQTVTDSITLTNATSYVAPVEANSRYHVNGYFMYSNVDASSTNDFQCDWTLPASGAGIWTPTQQASASSSTTAATIVAGAFSLSTSLSLGVVSGSTLGTPFNMFFTTSGTSGNLQFRFAEVSAVGGVTSVTLKSGSWFHIWKVA